MEKEKSLTLWLEVIWWAITVLIVFGVLYPIHKSFYVWKFEAWNIIFIVVFLTLVRYTFLLKHTFLARRQGLKVGLLLAMFPLCFTMIHGLNKFMTYIEEHSWEPFTGHLPAAEKLAIESYIWNEMLFFAIGSILISILFAARMFMSVWRVHNRGTV